MASLQVDYHAHELVDKAQDDDHQFTMLDCSRSISYYANVITIK